MSFAEKVRNLLKERRLTQADLAEMLGTNQQQVSRWLEKNAPPKWEYLLKLSRALGVTCDYLIDPAQAEPAGPEMSLDEHYIVRVIRALHLTFEDAAERLASEPSAAGPRGVGRTQAIQDLSSQAVRDAETKRRLGFELDVDMESAEGDCCPIPRHTGRRG